MNVEGTLFAAVCFLVLDAPECGKPSGSVVEITIASSWHWKSWWLSERWTGVCSVSMLRKKLEGLGSQPVCLELG